MDATNNFKEKICKNCKCNNECDHKNIDLFDCTNNVLGEDAWIAYVFIILALAFADNKND